MSKSKIEIESTDSIYDIKEKMDKYMLEIKKSKYDFVLKFINYILKKENTSLFKIKYLKKSILVKINIEKLLEKYEEKFKNQNIKVKKEDDIITIIKKVLLTINYKFKKTIKDEEEYYSIITD
jgi:hypothetical protein